MTLVDPGESGFDPDRLARLDAFLERTYVGPGRLAGCQVTIARHHHVAYRRSLGLADRERGVPVADDTVWRLYSMTKPVTSVALLQQVEGGELLLTDPVHRYLPEFRHVEVAELGDDGELHPVDGARPMTVLDALTHMTGLAGGVSLDHPTDRAFAATLRANKSGMTLAAACELLAGFPLKFAPGTRWNYGLSTDLCARLVEVCSGEPFDRYLEHHILGPLGMADTAFWVRPEAAPRLAACYRYRPGGTPELTDDPQTSRTLRPRSYHSGAGGLLGTSDDYVRFCRMLLNGGELDGRRSWGAAPSTS